MNQQGVENALFFIKKLKEVEPSTENGNWKQMKRPFNEPDWFEWIVILIIVCLVLWFYHIR
jgi:hypothetical protein